MSNRVRLEDEVVLDARADAHELTLVRVRVAVAGALQRALVVGRPAGATLATLTAATVEELDALGDDLDRLPFAALGGFPLVPIQAPVDGDATTTAHIAMDRLAGEPVEADVEEVGLLRILALGGLADGVASNAQLADIATRWERPQLWVAGQTADEHDTVDVRVGHGFSFAVWLAL